MRALSRLDSNGDTKVFWDENDPGTWAEAQQLFDRHVANGGAVFLEQAEGQGGGQVKAFDPQADMIAVPRIVGG